MSIVSTSAPPKCDSTNSKVGINEWGTHGIPCQTTRGLRSFIDRQGTPRFYCSVRDHRLNVERRFGVLETVEPCFICHRLDPILQGIYTRVTAGGDVVNLCDLCRERADLPEDRDWDERPGSGAFV